LTPKLLQFLGFFIAGHILVWLQSSGQFIWKSFRDNTFLLCLMGVPMAYLFITATRIGYESFDQKLWPVRILGFSIGTMVFSGMTYFCLGEGLTLKTCISLLLCIAIILVQIAL
jgi:hypothetical protein